MMANNNSLYIYEFDTEDFVVLTMKAKIREERLFSFITTKGKISKSAIGKIQHIYKGNHTNYVFITDHEIEDAPELFFRHLHQHRKR